MLNVSVRAAESDRRLNGVAPGSARAELTIARHHARNAHEATQIVTRPDSIAMAGSTPLEGLHGRSQ